MIVKQDFYCTPVKESRRLHIYLPDNYYKTDERYPVVYMFDGHNLFFDEDATFGTCQGMKEFMDSYRKKLIIVGIECSKVGNNRLSEYSPYDIKMPMFGEIKGMGDVIMDWVITELKPHIDANFRTIPFRECTAISGSSMGGLMALYGVIRYNQYISKAASISPAIITSYYQFKKELADTKIDPDTRVYFSWGTEEWGGYDCMGAKRIFELEKDIQQQGGKTYILCQEGGHHGEASWAKQTGTWMDFLWF